MIEHPVLPVIAENIPSELKQIPQWVLWRLEINKDGKPTKVPYQPNGVHAKANDQSTWTDFETALTTYQRGGWSGIGIVLTANDKIIGVDLDKCLNPETGELDPNAARNVNDLPTYCEISPSGRGLRLFGFGTLPTGGRKKGSVEMYETGRYLTVTGHRFNGHDALAEITPQLAEAHARIFGQRPHQEAPQEAQEGHRAEIAALPPEEDDNAIIGRLCGARGAFRSLWRGNLDEYENDHSKGDLALCNFLATACHGRIEQMDRIFRRSHLARHKWDEVHSVDGKTYGEMTLRKALESWARRRNEEDDQVALRRQWLDQFVYLPSEDRFVHKEKLTVLKPAGFNQMAHHTFPNQWGRTLPHRQFMLEQLDVADQETYLPGRPMMVEHGPMVLFNAYRAPELPEPRYDATEEKLFLDHVEYACGGDLDAKDALLNWMASLIQHPERKIRWVPLLISPAKGTGKGLLIDLMTALLGPSNCGKLDNHSIGGKFHDALVFKLLIAIPELKMFEDQRDRLNEFKEFITDPTVNCNRKGRPAITVDNVANFIATSNFEAPIKIDPDERRYMVVTNHAMPRSRAYYDHFVKTFLPTEGGSVAPILHFLQNRDLSQFNPNSAPITEAMRAMCEVGLSPMQAMLRRTIDAGQWPFDSDFVTYNELRDACVQAAAKTNDLKPMWPSQVTEAATHLGLAPLGRYLVNGQQDRFYAIRNQEKWRDAPKHVIREMLASRPSRGSGGTVVHGNFSR